MIRVLILLLVVKDLAADRLYFPVISVYVKGLGEYEKTLGLSILVFPRDPSYIFTVVEGRYPLAPTIIPKPTVTFP